MPFQAFVDADFASDESGVAVEVEGDTYEMAVDADTLMGSNTL